MGKIASLINAGMSIEDRTKALRLDAEFTDLAKKVVTLEAQVQKLEAEVNPLRRTIEKHEQKIAHLSAQPKLTFNQATGTYIDPSGIHYCTKCRAEDKYSPLKNGAHGWRCMVCQTPYPDPSRPEPYTPIRRRGPADKIAGY